MLYSLLYISQPLDGESSVMYMEAVPNQGSQKVPVVQLNLHCLEVFKSSGIKE
jgi:hypothetical protein